MADDKHPEIVIIRRPLDHGDEAHHGGVWKIAYADFMTAMMAFFLVLWLINSTNSATRASVARYFNPVKLADATMSKKGIHDPQDHKDTPVEDAPTQNGPNAATPAAGPKTGDASKPVADPKMQPTDQSAAAPASDTVASDTAAPTTHFSDTQLFSDPYAVLAEIAGGAGQGPQAQDLRADSTRAASGQSGLANGDAFRDPFTPMTRTVAPNTKIDPAGDVLQSAAPASAPPVANPPAEAVSRQPVEPKPAAAKVADLSKVALAAAAASAAEAAQLRGDIARVVAQEGNGDKTKTPDFDVQSTGDGLLISLTDDANFGMFAIGSAEPQAKIVKIMADVAGLLKARPGQIIIRGFTDGRPFKGGGSDNWRLSADRAQMAHYMLVRGGLDEKRIDRIEGWADRQLKVPSDPGAAENRRIEILLRKPKP